MNCNSNCGYPPRNPNSAGLCQPFCSQNPCGSRVQSMPCPPPRPYPFFGPTEKFPVGMGYVPVQPWECPYPIERGFQRGTIFQSLDYPFVMGRCRS